MNHQCCPGENCPETPQRPSAGGLQIFCLNHCQIQKKKFKENEKKSFLKILSGFASDLAKTTGDPPKNVQGYLYQNYSFDQRKICTYTKQKASNGLPNNLNGFLGPSMKYF